MTPEEKQTLLDDMNQQIITYTKWIDDYKAKIEAAKYILECLKTRETK